MADFRLDVREGTFSVRTNGTPIVPGNAQASLIYQRISSKDPARRMPPEYSHKKLTVEQIELLKRWIEQGATWKEHWAFVAPVRSPLPLVKEENWVRNPIDQFILSRLEASGLSPAAEADRRTLARRLSLDLTGLPPDPTMVEEFEKDTSKDAYEKLVDRLLDSRHWGEHRARYWLDAARYADTHGLHYDNYREMWPYRDWVIDAFNRNLPFDRFTLEQLAGDLLPNHTLEQQIASGFQRCNVTTNEGGVIIEEVEAIYAKDRVDTTGTVWLGMTVGCATCHDHKFDPISTKDYYSLAAFFRNTTQHTMDGNVHDTPPVIVVPRDDDRSRWEQLTREKENIGSQMQQLREEADPSFRTWLQSDARRTLKSPLDDGSELVALFVANPPQAQSRQRTSQVELHGETRVGESNFPGLGALHFGATGQAELPGVPELSSGKPFSIATWILFPKGEDSFVVASQTDAEERGWVLDIGERRPGFRLGADKEKRIRLLAEFAEELKPGSWNHLAVTYDGRGELTSLAMYINGKKVNGKITGELQGEFQTNALLHLGNQGDRFFPGGAISDFRVFNRLLSDEEVWLTYRWPMLALAHEKSASQLSSDEQSALRVYFLNHEGDRYRQLVSTLRKIDGEQREIRHRGAVTHVMEERTDSQPMAKVLYRGQYDQPREEVSPNVPAALPPMPSSFPRNRLGLAQWIVDPSNPLTARVTVNRFWQEVFGTGLVKTAEDFGSQGEPPFHPQLLDWLVLEFRESGWDVKKFFRLLVTSATYRQAALATKEKLEKDPDNRLLSRGPRFRMDGEMIRDYALAASGLLVRTIGGPSVKPYQPEGIWEVVAMEDSNTRFYKQEHGDKLYRRSLYTFWKRSAPPASLEIFNAPSRENCTVRRERTDTPLQALVTMNGPQFVEAARHLAEMAIRSNSGNLEREMDFISARLLARPFDVKEGEIVRREFRDCLQYYQSNPEEVRKLLAVGESKTDQKMPMPDLAALTLVVNQVMNLDEVMNK